ncbi:MAG: SIMPL domain-containing protein [Dehalococcoidia bacterium]
MIIKRVVVSMVIVGALALGVACTQASIPTPTPSGDSPGSELPTGNNGSSALSPGRLEAAGFTSFAAPQVSYDTQQAGIWVGGSGRVVVTPDLALLSLGVEARASTVREAREDAATAMTEVMAVLTGSGVEEQDIRTQYFNIQPEYTWNETDRKQEIIGYRVTNTVSVKVRDLEGLGSLIDQVADAGGDLVRMNNISFTVEHPGQFASQAREAAVEDAMAKAQQFADLTGVTLGKLVYIAESGGNVPVVRDYARAEMAMDSAVAAPPTPISQGDMDIIVYVQAVFGIA